MLDKWGEKWQVCIRRGSWGQTRSVSPCHREGGVSKPLQALLNIKISPVISDGPTSFPGWDQQPPGGFPENSHHLRAGTKLPSGIGQSGPSPRGKRKRDLFFLGRNAVSSCSSSSWAGHTRPISDSYRNQSNCFFRGKIIVIIKNKKRKKVNVSFSSDFKAERNKSLGRDILLRQSFFLRTARINKMYLNLWGGQNTESNKALWRCRVFWQSTYSYQWCPFQTLLTKTEEISNALFFITIHSRPFWWFLHQFCSNLSNLQIC